MRLRKLVFFVSLGNRLKSSYIFKFSFGKMLKHIKVYAIVRFMGDKHFLISSRILTNGPFPTGKLADGKAGRMVSLFLWK